MMLRAPVRGALAACACIAGAFAPAAAWAQSVPGTQPSMLSTQPDVLGTPPADLTDIFLTAGIGETDNVGLAATGAESQTIANLGVMVDVERNDPLLQGILKGDVSYLDFLQHAYPGQVVGRLDGNGSYALVPDNIKWVLQDSYGTSQVDPLAPVDRNNVQSVNVLSTGPDFVMRPSDSVFLHLGARYALVDYETSPFNSHQLLGLAAIGDDLSVASSISLNADVSQIRFQDTDVNPDYDRRKFYLRYDTRGSRTTLSLDLGVAQVDDTGPWVSALLAQLTLARDLTPFQSVSISGGRQFTDASDSFSGLTSGAAATTPIAPGVGSAGNYLDTYGSLGWHFKEDRTIIDVTGRWDRDTYTIEPTPLQLEEFIAEGIFAAGLDVTRASVQARVQRDIAPNLTAEVHAGYTHENYETIGFIDHLVLAGLGVTYKRNHRLQYRLTFDHNGRTAETVPTLVAEQGLGTGYTQNEIFVTAVYQLSE
jgi:hypothetical protein